MRLSVLLFAVCVCVTGIYGMAMMSTISKPKRVCVIGAGISGLASARYLKELGVDFTVLETTRYVGGTWRYDPRVGLDENGIPLHTSMYDDLRTNLPIAAMELMGFPAPRGNSSFPSRQQYYEYLQSFAKHFDLEKHIKFLHLVMSVRKDGNVWTVKYKHVLTGEQFTEHYDYVFLCNGHYSEPKYPSIPGQEKFKGTRVGIGTITHSHDYRTPEPYKDRKVLVIGAGPSGMDIGLLAAEVAKKLIHSHHSKINFTTPWPANFVIKPDVREFTENGAVFEDGTFEELDDVIYCTGYQYSYPFLDATSGLTLAPTHVVPLYRYLVNINEPTMVVLGLVVRCCVVAAIDAQARYAAALVTGNFTLPSKEVMMREWQRRADQVQSAGRPMLHIHMLGEKEDEYYEDLFKESGTARVPPVLFKMRTASVGRMMKNLYMYRNYEYTIVDENTFTYRYKDPCGNKERCIR